MVKLGEIFTITSGGTPDKKKSSYYTGGTIPWVKTGDLKSKYVAEGVECITEEGLNNSSAKLFPPKESCHQYSKNFSFCPVFRQMLW